MTAGVWSQFKQFALKGNVVDLAVGVIIGAAFGKVVSALVDQVLTPPLGLLIGGMDFSHLRLVLLAARGDQPEVAVGYGIFLQAVVNFIIVAGALFFLIKLMNELNLEATALAPPTTPAAPATPAAPTPASAVTQTEAATSTAEAVQLLKEIRDSLKRS